MTDSEIYHVFNSHGHTEVARGAAELEDRLKEKPEAMLRREVAMASPGLSKEGRQAIAFAQMELDRRADEEAYTRAKELANRTTWMSAGAAAVATVLGAIVGSFLTVWLGH